MARFWSCCGLGLILGLALAGCSEVVSGAGGTGGGTGGDPNTGGAPGTGGMMAVNPLEVVSTDPADAATSVDTEVEVSATLSEALQMPDAEPPAFALQRTDGDTVDGAVMLFRGVG